VFQTKKSFKELMEDFVDENGLKEAYYLMQIEESSEEILDVDAGGGFGRKRGPLAMHSTQEWPIWARYRDWAYSRKFGSRISMKILYKHADFDE